MHLVSRLRLFVLAAFAAAVVAPAAWAGPDFPLIAAHVPNYPPNYKYFDLVVQSPGASVADGKAANPRALWLMLGMGGATYGSEISDQPGFNKARCMLRHADGSGWTGVQPFNMTLPDCTDDIADRIAALAKQMGLYTSPWDGIYQDSLSYHPYQYVQRPSPGMTDVDANLDGKADTQAQLEAAWRTGMIRFTARLRADLPGKLVLANGPLWGNLTNLDGVDGAMIEHAPDDMFFDRYGWNVQLLKDQADAWYAVDTGRPRFVTALSYWKIGVDVPPDGRTQMQLDPNAQQRMRFGLTSSLMAGAYFDFQYSNAQGSAAVYDEYWGGSLDRQGYLGQPLAPARQIATGVWRRDFENGVALVNETQSPATFDLSADHLHRLKGTQAPSVNNGAPVGSLTLPAKDGIILLRDAQAPPPPPPSQGTPAVSFVGVSAGQTLRGTVDWEATVTPAGGTVSQVDFIVDGVVKWTERVTPYQWNADGNFDTTKLADGSHTLGLTMTLTDGRTAQSSIQVQVANNAVPPPTAAPAVSFVGVAAGQTLHGTVDWEATVTPAGGTVSQVDFIVDGVVKWTERVTPYQWNADGNFDTTKLPDGSHTLGLVLTLTDGRTAQSSIQVQVANNAVPPPATPAVSFVGVAAGQTLHGTVDWEATVTPAGGTVSQVDFSIDGAVKWTERVTPYQWNADGNFDTTKLSNGTHTLGLTMTLTDGRTAQRSVQVVVSNP